MKRLKKIAEEDLNDDLNDTKVLLQRVDESSHQLKDIYYVLFDNLNNLSRSYPNLYKQVEMTVALPKNEDAAQVIQFDHDLHEILNHLLIDDQYLREYIGPSQLNENVKENNVNLNQ